MIKIVIRVYITDDITEQVKRENKITGVIFPLLPSIKYHFSDVDVFTPAISLPVT